MLAINIVVFAIAVRGHFVLVGDLMKSISVLSYDPERESLELIARDYETNWITAVEALDDDIYLGTENSHHLLALTRQSDAAAEEERKRLLHMGRFHIGELVNRIRHGNLSHGIKCLTVFPQAFGRFFSDVFARLWSDSQARIAVLYRQWRAGSHCNART